MKLLLLSACTFLTISAFAQISEADLQKRIQNSSLFKKPGTQLSLVPQRADRDSLLALMKMMAENNKNSTNQPVVKYYAPDNMPCRVPGLKDLEHMPNAWLGKDINVEPMPNPGKKQSEAGSR